MTSRTSFRSEVNLGILDRLRIAVQRYFLYSHPHERLFSGAIIFRAVLLILLMLKIGVEIMDHQDRLNLIRLVFLMYFIYVVFLGVVRFARPAVFLSNNSVRIQILLDTIFFSAFYFLVGELSTILVFLYLMPLIFAVDYLKQKKDILVTLILVVSAWCFTSVILIRGLDETEVSKTIMWWFGSSRLSLFMFAVATLLLLRRVTPFAQSRSVKTMLERKTDELLDGTYIASSDHRVLYASASLTNAIGPPGYRQSCFSYLAGSNHPCPGCILDEDLTSAQATRRVLTVNCTNIEGETFSAELDTELAPSAVGLEPTVLGSVRNLSQRSSLLDQVDHYLISLDGIVESRTEEARLQASEAAERISALFQTSVLGATSGELDGTLLAILQTALKLLDCPVGVIRLLSTDQDGTEQLRLANSYGVHPGSISEIEYLPLDSKAIASQVYSDGVPKQILDCQEENDYYYPEFACAHNIRGALALPLMAQKRKLGVMLLYRNQVQGFSSQDVQLAEVFANFAGMIASNSDLYEETRQLASQREQWLRVITELNARLAGNEKLDSIIQRLLRHIRENLNVESTSIFLLQDGLLTKQANSGLPKNFLPNESYRPGRGLTGKAIIPSPQEDSYSPGIVLNNSADGDLSDEDMGLLSYPLVLQSGKVSHLVVIPLTNRHGPFGVLRVLNCLDARGSICTDGFTEDHLDLLTVISSFVSIAVEYARNRDDIVEDVKEKEQLQTASRRLAAKLNMNQLIEEILDLGTSVFDADHVGFIEIVDGKSFGNIYSNYLETNVASELAPRKDGIASEILQTGKPVFFDRADDSSDHNPALLSIGIKSYAGIPVVDEDLLRAIIFLHNVEPVKYSAKQPLLLTFANQVAVTMRNCELFRREQIRRGWAENLQMASSAVLSSLKYEDIIRLILDQLSDVIAYDTASIQVKNDSVLEIVEAKGFLDRDKIIGLRFPLDTSFPNYKVITRNETTIVPDVRVDYPHFKDPKWGATHTRSWLGVPLIHKGKPIGMLALDNNTPGFYKEHHKKLARSFADQAASAIGTANLFGRINNKLDQTMTLSQISRDVVSTSEVKKLYQQSAKWAKELIDHADGAVFHVYKNGSLEPTAISYSPHDLAYELVQKLNYYATVFAPRWDSERELVLQPSNNDYPDLPQSTRFAPVQIGKKKIGILSIFSQESDCFSEDDELVMVQLTSILGTAIANLDVWTSRDSARRRLQQILESIDEFYLGHTWGDLCSAILNTSNQVLGCDTSVLVWQSTNNLQIAVDRNDSNGLWPEWEQAEAYFDLLEHDDLASNWQTLEYCDAEWLPEMTLQTSIKGSVENLFARKTENEFHRNDYSIIKVPLRMPNIGRIGTLFLLKKGPQVWYDIDDQQLINVFSNFAATIILNWELFNDTKKQKSHLQDYLHSVSSQLGGQMDFPGLCAFFAKTGAAFANADICLLYLADNGSDDIRYVASSDASLDQHPSEPVIQVQQLLSLLQKENTYSDGVLLMESKELADFLATAETDDNSITSCALNNSTAMLLSPMIVNSDELVGVMLAVNKYPSEGLDNFSDLEMDLFSTLSSQGALEIVRQQRLGELREEAAKIERKRFELEIHDLLSIISTGAAWEAENIRDKIMAELDEDTAYGFERMMQTLNRAAAELNFILADLRISELDKQDLTTALESYGNLIGYGYVIVAGDREKSLPRRYHHALYRIGQEAISNALKHGQVRDIPGGTVEVDLDFESIPNGVLLKIQDNGIGFDAINVMDREMAVPSGLVRLKELAERKGIELTINSVPLKGTEVVARTVFEVSSEV